MPPFRTISVFAGNMYLLSVSGSGLHDLDANALSWFTSLEVVGIYWVAKSFASLLSRISDPVLSALLPELSRFWAALASNGLALVLYLVLIPRFGGMGASLAYGTGLAAASVIAAAISWRACVVPMFAPTASALPVDVR